MIQVIFYKAKGNFFDKLIRWRTKGKYSHCELRIGNINYTSSPRDGGVVKRSFYTGKSWDSLFINVPQQSIEDFYQEHKDKKYDWLGIFFTQALNLGIEHKSRFFCSEYCLTNIQNHLDLRYEPSTVNPSRLYNILVQYNEKNIND